MGMTAIEHGKCFTQGLILRKCSVIVSCYLVRHFSILEYSQRFPKEVLLFLKNGGRSTVPFISPSKLLHSVICPVDWPQTFQLFGLIEGIRSVENPKQQLRPKFFVQFCHAERGTLSMEWHPFQQLHIHKIPSDPGRMVPFFDSLEPSWEWRKPKILRQVHDLKITHGYYVHVVLEIGLIL